MPTRSTIYHLEMLSEQALKASPEPSGGLDLRCIERSDPTLNRRFYVGVGGDWNWIDRLSWNQARWRAYLEREQQETWVLYVDNQEAGFFELEHQGDSVELVYFGLLPAFIGRGLGGPLLTRAVQRAWQLNPKRVWVHTCSEDHPAALRNYQAKGFRLFKQEHQWVDITPRAKDLDNGA